MIFKFFHVVTMFGAVTLLFAMETLLYRAARRGDVAGVKAIAAHGSAVTRIGEILFIVGIVFGLLAAITIGFNLLAPWLILAYVIVAAMLFLGIAVEEPAVERLVAAIEANGDGPPSEEVQRRMADRRGPTAIAISAVLYVAIVFVMVIKPFS